MTVDDEVSTPSAARRPGRRRDESLDDVILLAARDLLGERGYEGMTMDAVAERAGAGKATLYRRWPSKVDLTIDAVTCGAHVRSVDELPDTGTLRGDLHAIRDAMIHDKESAIMNGLVAALHENPEVAAVFHEQFVTRRFALMRDVLERAQERGEVPPGKDLDMIASVIPAMVSYRKLVARQKLTSEYVTRLIDAVLVPLATGHDVTD